MKKKRDTAQQKRDQSHELIEHMLQERQQVLVLLWELSKLDFASVDTAMLEMLEEFLELVVDYIAAGHFGLYQRIEEGNERRRSVLTVASEIYPRIVATSDTAVAFAERYDALDEELIRTSMSQDLSRLGEALTSRIELEDRLIHGMLGRNARKSTGAAGR